MMRFEALPAIDLTHSKWDELVGQAGESMPFHRAGWSECVRRVYGHPAWMFVVSYRQDVLACLPAIEMRSLLRRRFMVSLPYASYGGVVSRDRTAHAALIAGARELCGPSSWSYVEVRQKGGTALELPGPPPSHTGFDLDMRVKTTEQLWKQLRPSWRRNIRRAERVTEVKMGHNQLDAFYSVFREGMRELGSPAHPLEWFRFLAECLPGAVDVAVAYREGMPVASALQLRGYPSVYYCWGAVLRAFAGLSNHVLFWTLINHYHGLGFARFDFGRSPIGTGGAFFKKGWRAEPVPLQFGYVAPRPMRWPGRSPAAMRRRLLSAVWGRVPRFVADRFGPLLRGYIP